MELNHTPGPWVWKDGFNGLNSAHGEILNWYSYEGMHLDPKNTKGNAALIAAAPDLLEACQYAIRALEGMPDHVHNVTEWMLKTAVSKATTIIDD